MGGRIIFVLVAVVVLGALLYGFRSGTTGGKFNFQSLLPHFPTSTPYGAPPFYTPPPPSMVPVVGFATTSYVSPINVPTGFTASDLSPFFQQVRLGGVSPGGWFSQSQISLYAYLTSQTSTIDVTGWQIKTNRGGEYIPQAVQVYDPLGLNPATDIRLTNGDMLNIYSTWAPVNLRLNKCMGYLPNKSQFNPPLPQNCPYVDRSSLQSLSGACQNYILSLWSCAMPNMASFQIPQNDYACVNYLQNHFSYYSCFDEHQADSDFLSHEIRVWIGGSPLDPSHDRVLLLDRAGLLVDTYSY